MKRIKKLNELVKFLFKNYKIKITDYAYMDQVIIHDAEEQYGLELKNTELQYTKAAIKMLLYKKEIQEYELREKEDNFVIHKFND